MKKNRIVKVQRIGAKILLTVPREVVGQLGGVDYLSVKFDDGRLVYSPVQEVS